jgi:hypothetical protein
MSKYTDECKIQVKKIDENQYALVEKVPGLGGGWVTGKVAAWTVRGVGYGAFGIACILHPGNLAEAHIVYEAIEATALTAEVVGTCLPTP